MNAFEKRPAVIVRPSARRKNDLVCVGLEVIHMITQEHAGELLRALTLPDRVVTDIEFRLRCDVSDLDLISVIDAVRSLPSLETASIHASAHVCDTTALVELFAAVPVAISVRWYSSDVDSLYVLADGGIASNMVEVHISPPFHVPTKFCPTRLIPPTMDNILLVLDLSTMTVEASPAQLAAIVGRCPSLQTFTLGGCLLTVEDKPWLSDMDVSPLAMALGRLPNLQVVRITSLGDLPSGMLYTMAAGLVGHAALRCFAVASHSIDITTAVLGGAGPLCQLVEHTPHLQTLTIDRGVVTDAAMAVLIQAVGHSTSLAYLRPPIRDAACPDPILSLLTAAAKRNTRLQGIDWSVRTGNATRGVAFHPEFTRQIHHNRRRAMMLPRALAWIMAGHRQTPPLRLPAELWDQVIVDDFLVPPTCEPVLNWSSTYLNLF